MSRLRLLTAVMAAALISGLSVNAADAASQSATLSMPRAINENVRFGVAGFVTPIQAGRPVELQVKSGKRWKKVATARQTQYGGLTFYGKVRRTAQAKQTRGKEVRQFRMRARATSSLPEKVSRPVKVTVLLDPKVYYRVLKASVQHTANAQMARSGCSDVIASFSATKRTSASLGPAEKGRPKWKAKRLANGAITADVGPRVSTRWIQNLAGCRYDPAPAACTTTVAEEPSRDGRQPMWVTVKVPRSGSKGTVLFATPTLSVGYPQASDAVCNVPWMLGGTVGAKIRTVPVSRAKLLGKKPFTVRVQGNAAWTKDAISGSPADLKLRFTESITLQRVDASGRKLR